MKGIYFNRVVKKILKSKGTIIDSDKAKQIILEIMDNNFSDKKAYKLIYYLKNKGYIIPLKKDIYFITNPETKSNQNELIEKYYWQILKKNCNYYLMNDRYIGGIKGLELNTSNFDIPEDIDIYNPYKQSKEVVLIGKYINFKKYTIKNEDLFKKFKKFTIKIKIGKISFLVANTELSILESLYNPNILSGNYSQELVKKILRKNKKSLNLDTIIDIIRLGKHHSSINRLYKISKNVDDIIPQEIAKIIKRYSFFLEI